MKSVLHLSLHLKGENGKTGSQGLPGLRVKSSDYLNQ